jgi:hypothetical protein
MFYETVAQSDRATTLSVPGEGEVGAFIVKNEAIKWMIPYR